MIDWYFLKHVDLENIQQELWGCRKVQLLARDDDDEIEANGDPDLRLDHVEGVAEVRCGEQDALIATQSGRFVDLARGEPRVARIVFDVDHEGDMALMRRLQLGEIEVAAID